MFAARVKIYIMATIALKKTIFRIGFLILLVIGGCGDDKRAAAPVDQDDSGQSDEAGARDAGKDAAPDGDSASTQEDSGGAYQFGDEDWFEVDLEYVNGFYDQRGFELAVGSSDFGLAFEYQDRMNDCGSRIDMVRIPVSGAIPKAATLVSVDSASCSKATEPALVSYNGSFAALCSDTRSGRVELYRVEPDSSGAPSAITDSQSIERHAALTVVDSRLLAAWVAEDATTGKRVIYTRLLGDEGSEPVAVVTEDAGRTPQDLVLTHVGTKKAVLGWVDVSETTRGIYLQRLMSDGTADGVPQQVPAL